MFAPNMDLLPLKLSLFFFNGAVFAITPYLTIHMKDIGISDVDIALMYAILPFCVFIAPPIVGFFADKLGNYTRVLLANIILCAAFHTLLLAVPSADHHVNYPDSDLKIVGKDVHLSWKLCENDGSGCTRIRNPEKNDQDPIPIFFEILDCNLTCPDYPQLDEEIRKSNYLGTPLTYEDIICRQFGVKHCKVWPGQRKAHFKRINTNVSGNPSCGKAHIDFYTDSDPCEIDSIFEEEMLGLLPNCSAYCKVRTNLIRACGEEDHGNRLITNAIYFIFRMLATMSLASCFILLDAQTIQMCTVEEKQGNRGSYGRQIMYKTLAQAIISPTVGLLMDYISETHGKPNYAVPFIIGDAMLLITFLCVYNINKDLELPKADDSLKGVKEIFTNIDIVIFLVIMFVCGTMYGFVETFLFVFLKEDLHAPIFLLGLTITTGALVSIPFLYYSDTIVKKVGCKFLFALALAMYSVRYIGFSFIRCAWYAFPFEALEAFTVGLFQVSAASYIKQVAPKGSLATLTGLYGGMHNGFGMGSGGLLGGILIEQTKSTHKAFRIFGIGAAVCTGIFVFYWFFDYQRKKNVTITKIEREAGDGDGNSKEENMNETEDDSFLGKDSAENEMLEFGRESPAGSYSP